MWGMVTLVEKTRAYRPRLRHSTLINTCEALTKHLYSPCTGRANAACTDWHTQAVECVKSVDVARKPSAATCRDT